MNLWHFRFIDEDRDHAFAQLQAGSDLYSYEVLRTIQPGAAGFVLRPRPTFSDDGEQMALFAPTNAGRDEGAVIAANPEIERELTGTIDAIRAKFGTAALGPAALAEAGKLRVKRQGDTQWGPNAPSTANPTD